MARMTRKSVGKAIERPTAIRKTKTPIQNIKNSSDMEDSEDELAQSGVKLEDPEIIVLESKPVKRQARKSTYSTTTSNASDFDDYYDTPGTSAMATPAAEPIFKGKGKGRAADPFKVEDDLVESFSTKRKRTDAKDAQVLADELMAQKLQAQEYDEDEDDEPLAKRRLVEDTEDSFLSDLDSADDYEEEYNARRSKKIVKKPASKSTKTKRELDLSEDDSDFSTSDDGSEDEDHQPIEGDGIRTAIPTAEEIRGYRTHHRNGRRYNRAERDREHLEKNHPELPSLWEDLAAVPVIKPVAIQQPDSINRSLKPFQLEGVDWMIKQEKTAYKGGLLGDEMGMGKTIQTVTLMMSDYPQKNPTLVIVPPVALVQWSTEISSYTDGKLKVLIHHNSNAQVKKLKAKDLMKYDVVMISYSGLESIFRKESKGFARDGGVVKENSRIHAVHWHRVILDEAHSIKSRTSNVSKACFALKADYRWCLSGTPVQNRIGEFFSLLRFLEVKPFACYFCKECPCAELHWSQNEKKACNSCGHTGFQHVSIFNQELLNPLIGAGSLAKRKEALGKLRLLTDRIMLRRMKKNHTASMELPPKNIRIHSEFFSEKEKDFSSSIMTNNTREFDTYVAKGVMLNNYANIFGLIMQMRQVANHPDLLLKKHSADGQNPNILVCGLCAEVAEEPIRSRCQHVFCRQCAKQYTESLAGQEPDCPTCHLPLSIDFDQPDIEQDEGSVKKNSIINRIKMENWTSSTKIEMLVYDLYKLRKKHQTHKSIVFSQFTSMLQLVEWRLKRAGFKTVMLDGSMTPAARAKSIDYFMKNVEVEVFLVSLKAGGVALNLTEASHVFLIDPWWNPAAEWQSADRCHRIGQTRPCSVTRLVIEDSVESRIVELQEKKTNLIASTVNNDDVAMEKLTPQDMQFLFRGS